MTGAELIAVERQRQIREEGWTAEHDATHTDAEMAMAARCYIEVNNSTVPEKVPAPRGWPWHWKWWKPSADPIRNLVKAGALIAAEIDRLQRRQESPS